MENKYEKNIHGVEYIIEAYNKNGQLLARWEWNESRTKTDIIERYHDNGRLKARYEWNESRTETLLVKSEDMAIPDTAPEAPVEAKLDSVPLFQYNVAIEGQANMLRHIEFLNRELERKDAEIKKRQKLIDRYKRKYGMLYK